MNTLMNQELKTFVQQKAKANEIMVVITKKLEVNVIPEFSALFSKKTNSLSSIPLVFMKFYRVKEKFKKYWSKVVRESTEKWNVMRRRSHFLILRNKIIKLLKELI